MYKNMNKGKKSVEKPFPLYQTYTPTVIENYKTKSGSPYKKEASGSSMENQLLSLEHTCW